MSRTERNARQRTARNLYNELTYKTVSFRIRQDGGDGFSKDDLTTAAADAGQSVNAWIIEAIRARLAGGDRE